MGLGIHKHQHQIQELSSQITQSIKGAFGVLGFHLRKAKDMILVFLENLKEKVMGLPSAFSSTAEFQDNGASTSTRSTVAVDRIKDFVLDLGNTEEESGE